MEPGYNIWCNQHQNRLYMVLTGALPDDMAREAADKIIEEAAKLKPGFAVINDIADLESLSPIGSKEIQRAQAHLSQHGVRRIIRVMRFCTDGRRQPMLPNAVTSVEEADALLDREGRY